MATNKTSQYITSLVDYVLDTKPYHSKLTDVVEEYQFFDNMSVSITENFFVKNKINPTYLYNYFSGGDSTFRTTQLKQLHTNLKTEFPLNEPGMPGSIKVFRDENTDMASVPFVYSKKAFHGIGVADVLIERNGERLQVEPIVEGVDYFQSHGSIQFQIKQTTDANTNFIPVWADTRDDNVITTASAVTKILAEDASNPSSAISQIKNLLTQIKLIPPTSMQALSEVNTLLTQVNSGSLPQDYSTLLAYLNGGVDSNGAAIPSTPVLSGYFGWEGNDTLTQKYVSEKFSQLSPALYFNKFSDMSIRESGKAGYDEVSNQFLRISNITVTSNAAAGDVWSIIAEDDLIPLYGVFSSVDGYIGSFTVNSSTVFSSSTISFTATFISQAQSGEVLKIKNRNRIVFSESAPLETWNIIKVNPLSYSRPILISTRYGYIEDLSPSPVIGRVTIIDQSIPSGTVVLTARADGIHFDLTSLVEPSYTDVVTVGTAFTNRLGFTIRAGSVIGFRAGDKFFIDIINEPAKIVDLDLGYGFDLDSFDNPDLVYNNTNSSDSDYQRKINFVFDTRFTDYNTANLNLTISQTAVSGRKWRIKAIPNTARPIATLKKDGSGPSASIDLQESTSGISPDPTLTAAPLYETLGPIASNSIPDLVLYYSDTFQIEYSDDDFNTTTILGTCAVGSSFTSVAEGISFDLVAGSKPFVAVKADDSPGPLVEGGDVFSFEVRNDPPYLSENLVGLTSGAIARLIMNGDGFHECPAASWTISFSSSTDFTVSGIQTEENAGQQVPNGPAVCSLLTQGTLPFEGYSFNNLGVNFTIVPGDIGLGSGDTFLFRTYSSKPTYLVHGSVSGWKEEAEVGVPYWNGLIGFNIELPEADLFDQSLQYPRIDNVNNTWMIGTGLLSLTRLRFDAPNLIYTLTPTPIGSSTPTGWYVSRSDIGAVGYLNQSGAFSDTYITLNSSGIPTSSISKLQLKIKADDFDLWNAKDTIIIRSKISGRMPVTNDFILVDKRTSDSLALNLAYGSVSSAPSLSPLAPVTIDVRFIDTYTGLNGLPLSSTSPETAILNNWIPLVLKPLDSSTSISEFSDQAAQHEVYSAGSGQRIGTLSTANSSYFPAEFEWDQTFFSQYLPLNTEANIVTYGSGFNEIVNAHISESLKFLIDGGPLSSDYLFNEDITIDIDDIYSSGSTTVFNEFLDPGHSNPLQTAGWRIKTQLGKWFGEDDSRNLSWNPESFSVTVQDSPFGGFLAGFDNLPFDDEGGELIPQYIDGVYQGLGPANFDAGTPLVGHFIEAQKLSALVSPSSDELARLNDLTNLLNNYLTDGTIAGTTYEQFMSAIATTTPELLASTGIGIPARGLGIDIVIGRDGVDVGSGTEIDIDLGIPRQPKPSTETTSTSINDALVIMVNPTNSEISGEVLDPLSEKTAIIYCSNWPASGSPPISSYEDYDTALAVTGIDSPYEGLTIPYGTLPGDTTTNFAARVFEFNFRVTASNLSFFESYPSLLIWILQPGDITWTAIPVVDNFDIGKYRITLASSTEAKFYLAPGP